MDVICEDLNLRQQLLPLYALLQRLPVKPWRSRKRERSRRKEWTISVWPALWPSCLGRWHVGPFKPFCYQTQQRSMRSTDPRVQVALLLPLSTSSAAPSRGPEDLGGHVLLLLLLGSCTLSLLPTKKGKVLEGSPLFFLPSWLEGNAQLLKENIGPDSGLRNNLGGLSSEQVSRSPQLYQFANCESKQQKKNVDKYSPCPPWLCAFCKRSF